MYRTAAPEYRPGALRYIAGLVVSIGALLASSSMEDTVRLTVWAAIVVGSIALVVFYLLRTPDDSLGILPTASMAERYGLFIIIVLGEVVLGVVNGLLAVGDLDFRTVATARGREHARASSKQERARQCLAKLDETDSAHLCDSRRGPDGDDRLAREPAMSGTRDGTAVSSRPSAISLSAPPKAA